MDSQTKFHFIAYVHQNGKVWELDGRGQGPVYKAECAKEAFGVTVSQILESYTKVDPNTRYSLMALAPNT